jgi:hypothetical protein
MLTVKGMVTTKVWYYILVASGYISESPNVNILKMRMKKIVLWLIKSFNWLGRAENCCFHGYDNSCELQDLKWRTFFQFVEMRKMLARATMEFWYHSQIYLFRFGMYLFLTDYVLQGRNSRLGLIAEHRDFSGSVNEEKFQVLAPCLTSYLRHDDSSPIFLPNYTSLLFQVSTPLLGGTCSSAAKASGLQ